MRQRLNSQLGMTRAIMSKDLDMVLLLGCTSIKVDEALGVGSPHKGISSTVDFVVIISGFRLPYLVGVLGEPRLAPGPSLATSTAASATNLILQFGGWVVWLHGLQISFGGTIKPVRE
jgi:hypothetical protein